MMSYVPKYGLLPTIARLSGFFLGGIFLYAAVPKIIDAQAFAESIRNYQLVPLWSIGFLARLLPAIEVVVGIALIVGIAQPSAALIASGMLAVFSAGMLQAMARDINLSCGCFGKGDSSPIGWWNILRNLGLIGLALLVVTYRPSRWPWSLRRPHA
ncbi:MAG: DoxX family membrane protein [Myxococcales bacterium]|nr:DoxX family membrane protein [Myxococcales bacterium]MCB9708855.1 DoxX family membrane protein [Myxococcales bacterium]